MNGMLDMLTDVNSSCVHTDTLMVEDLNATIPMTAVQPAYKLPDEEELHTSFEEAISDRLAALRWRLNHLSASSLYTHNTIMPSTDASVNTPVVEMATPPAASRFGNVWQRGVIFSGLAVMFTLLGFDLMGILVLHMR